jgi:hypothetical protein
VQKSDSRTKPSPAILSEFALGACGPAGAVSTAYVSIRQHTSGIGMRHSLLSSRSANSERACWRGVDGMRSAYVQSREHT